MRSIGRKQIFQVKNGPKTNKTLLVINVVLFFAALVISVLDVSAKEYTPAVAMLFVMFLTGVNAYGCWKRMNSKPHQ